MVTVLEAFGTSGVAITITLASLADGTSSFAGRASTAVDNTANLYDEALVAGIFKTGAGTQVAPKGLYVFAYATADGATTYTDGITGTDAGFTRTDPPNIAQLAFV